MVLYNAKCVATTTEIDLIEGLNLTTTVKSILGDLSLENSLNLTIWPYVVNQSVEITFTFHTLKSEESTAQSSASQAALTIQTQVKGLNKTYGNDGCEFFSVVSYNITGSAEDISGSGGNNNGNNAEATTNSGSSGPAQYYAIAGVAGILVLIVIILVAMRRRRRGESEDKAGFSLGAAGGAAAGDFSNPMYKTRARNVGFDCPIYDELDLVEDENAAVSSQRNSRFLLTCQQSMTWDDIA